MDLRGRFLAEPALQEEPCHAWWFSGPGSAKIQQNIGAMFLGQAALEYQEEDTKAMRRLKDHNQEKRKLHLKGPSPVWG